MTISNVLVTGAGGFIGERVTHRIALERDWEVTPLVHNLTGPNVMRLARLPVDIEQGSILDRRRMAAVMSGCDAVVHCAVGGKAATVTGTRTLLEVAERAGVDSFVHLSSASIHGHDFEGCIDESASFQPDNAYGKWKIRAEREIAAFDAANDLSPTIFRPFIVYGPHSEWVEIPCEAISEGPVLTDGGHGTVNQIYVDNLVDAIFCALETPAASGETFLLSDNEHVTWRQYYEALAQYIPESPPIRSQSARSIHRAKRRQAVRDNIIPPVRALTTVLSGEDTRQTVATELEQTPWVRALYARLPTNLQNTAYDFFFEHRQPVIPSDLSTASNATNAPDRYSLPRKTVMDMQSSIGTMSTASAQRVLDWEPAISFEEGISRVGQWLEFTNGPPVEPH